MQVSGIVARAPGLTNRAVMRSRAVLLVCLGLWALAVTGLAGYVLATAGRDEHIFLEGMHGRAAPTVVGTTVLLSFAAMVAATFLLPLGLLAAAVAWAATFVGQKYSRWSTVVVVVLFVVAGAGLALWQHIPGDWWVAPSGRGVPFWRVLHYETLQRQAAAGMLAMSAVSGWVLLAIAIWRPQPARAEPVGTSPGWYPVAPEVLRYWDGQQWTDHTANG